MVLISLASCFTHDQWPKDDTRKLRNGGEFDWIVVGAGTAGSALAGRLLQRKQEVLVLEAGEDPTFESRVPGLSLNTPLSEMDWQYTTQSNNKSCLAMKEQSCRIVKGKVLGGCSSIDHTLYVRGNKIDFDEWPLKGWSYEDVLPYILRQEGYEDYERLSSELKRYHNPNGPFKVSHYEATTFKWRDYITRSFVEIGLPFNIDVNGPAQIGVTKSVAAAYRGERVSSATAYLKPAAESKGSLLTMAKRATVLKIIFDDTKTATGVIVLLNTGNTVTIKAKKEILLCAGPINTPQILMLSGIGPENHLKSLGIKVTVNLPVGENLRDHLLVPIVVSANSHIAAISPIFSNKNDILKWSLFKTGPLATIGVTDVLAFWDTAGESQIPDVQFYHAHVKRHDRATLNLILNNRFNLDDKYINFLHKINRKSELVLFLPALLKPQSKGKILLKDNNPLSKPLIFTNYLDEENDFEVLLRGIRTIEKVLNTTEIRSQRADMIKLNLEECNGFQFRSDEYWRCYIKHMATSAFNHHGTTSKIITSDLKIRLPTNDNTSCGGCHRCRICRQRSIRCSRCAAADPDDVIKGLRIVDGSIIPSSPRGTTNVVCLVIAEKAADILGQEYGF